MTQALGAPIHVVNSSAWLNLTSGTAASTPVAELAVVEIVNEDAPGSQHVRVGFDLSALPMGSGSTFDATYDSHTAKLSAPLNCREAAANSSAVELAMAVPIVSLQTVPLTAEPAYINVTLDASFIPTTDDMSAPVAYPREPHAVHAPVSFALVARLDMNSLFRSLLHALAQQTDGARVFSAGMLEDITASPSLAALPAWQPPACTSIPDALTILDADVGFIHSSGDHVIGTSVRHTRAHTCCACCACCRHKQLRAATASRLTPCRI
ncbi:MAG: hypothetical protein EOO41_00810 [Methanobacteriota archaeon]|nr:MAG: hypothetical protein EOO41_00810 [Euryarchaeota archaeon]